MVTSDVAGCGTDVLVGSTPGDAYNEATRRRLNMVKEAEADVEQHALDVAPVATPATPKPSKRGGPRTFAGKKASSKNAVRHGILSADPLAGGELLEDWERHLEGIRDALRPGNPFEAVLVDDIALNRWQHSRLERASNAIVSAQIELASLQSRADLEEAYDALPEDERRWLGHDARGVLEVLSCIARGEVLQGVSDEVASGVKVALDTASAKLSGWQLHEVHEATEENCSGTSLTSYAVELAALSGCTESVLIAKACADAAAAAGFQTRRAAEDRLNQMVKVASAHMLTERQGALHGRYKTSLDKAFDRYVHMLEMSQRARCGELPAPVRLRME